MGELEVTAKGGRASFSGNENILKLTVVTVAQLCEMLKLLNCIV